MPDGKRKIFFRYTYSVAALCDAAALFINHIRDGGDKNEELAIMAVTFERALSVCPKCGKNVIRGNSAYGCIGYKDGCDFRVGTHICHRDLPKEEMSRLLATGATGIIRGFLSKNGKRFDGRLVLRDGRAVFDFPER